MRINYLLIGLMGLLAGGFFIISLKKLAFKYRLLVAQNVPLIGGISIGLSFFFACLFGFAFYKSLSPQLTGLLLASFIMLIFGVIDDRYELSVSAKFLAQLIAACILIFFGVKTRIIYIGNIANIIITFIWILGIINAFNHLDVLDGLAGGCAIIVSIGFFIIAVLNSDIKTLVLTLALMGSILSFLIFNLPPAKVYMGNSGSHFLGFILGAIAMMISYASLERKIALLSPLLILGFPVFDTAFLIWLRLIKKRLPFKKSDDHLALRFLALGYSKKKALLIMLSLCLFFSLCGVLISQVPNLFGSILIILTVLASLSIIFCMGRERVSF